MAPGRSIVAFFAAGIGGAHLRPFGPWQRHVTSFDQQTGSGWEWSTKIQMKRQTQTPWLDRHHQITIELNFWKLEGIKGIEPMISPIPSAKIALGRLNWFAHFKMGSLQGSTSWNEATNIYFSFIAGGIVKVTNRKFEDDLIELWVAQIVFIQFFCSSVYVSNQMLCIWCSV